MSRGDKLFNRNSEKIKTFKRYNLQKLNTQSPHSMESRNLSKGKVKRFVSLFCPHRKQLK